MLSYHGENRGERLGDAIEDFHLLKKSHKPCRGFHKVLKARRTCFISFIKLVLST